MRFFTIIDREMQKVLEYDQHQGIWKLHQYIGLIWMDKNNIGDFIERHAELIGEEIHANLEAVGLRIEPMHFCERCYDLPEDFVFCPYCGSQVKE